MSNEIAAMQHLLNACGEAADPTESSLKQVIARMAQLPDGWPKLTGAGFTSYGDFCPGEAPGQIAQRMRPYSDDHGVRGLSTISALTPQCVKAEARARKPPLAPGFVPACGCTRTVPS